LDDAYFFSSSFTFLGRAVVGTATVWVALVWVSVIEGDDDWCAASLEDLK